MGRIYTYFGKQTKHTAKLFKNVNLKIAYKNENTKERL